ncbi:response regulator transcription factor [Poseidonibacter sp.]|uniref:response regulator transcription factor n=1 Tax=Poseidonibacter sp. TaxID=2321188 RepID=UPI003C76A4D2
MQLDDLLVLYVNENYTNTSKDDIHKVNTVLEKTVQKVIYASTAEESMNQYKEHSPCLIIIDSDFKDNLFVKFLQEIRKDDIKTAFIILTKNTKNDYLLDLMELYLTKYIIKPFTKELLTSSLAKAMEIIERRIYSNVKLTKGVFFNFQTQSIIKDDKSYILTKKESLLINLFIKNPNRIITYEEIEYNIWNNQVSNGAFKSLIRDLRKKTFKTFIVNISGIGYRLNIKNNL